MSRSRREYVSTPGPTASHEDDEDEQVLSTRPPLPAAQSYSVRATSAYSTTPTLDHSLSTSAARSPAAGSRGSRAARSGSDPAMPQPGSSSSRQKVSAASSLDPASFLQHPAPEVQYEDEYEDAGARERSSQARRQSRRAGQQPPPLDPEVPAVAVQEWAGNSPRAARKGKASQSQVQEEYEEQYEGKGQYEERYSAPARGNGSNERGMEEGRGSEKWSDNDGRQYMRSASNEQQYSGRGYMAGRGEQGGELEQQDGQEEGWQDRGRSDRYERRGSVKAGDERASAGGDRKGRQRHRSAGGELELGGVGGSSSRASRKSSAFLGLSPNLLQLQSIRESGGGSSSGGARPEGGTARLAYGASSWDGDRPLDTGGSSWELEAAEEGQALLAAPWGGASAYAAGQADRGPGTVSGSGQHSGQGDGEDAVFYPGRGRGGARGGGGGISASFSAPHSLARGAAAEVALSAASDSAAASITAAAAAAAVAARSRSLTPLDRSSRPLDGTKGSEAGGGALGPRSATLPTLALAFSPPVPPPGPAKAPSVPLPEEDEDKESFLERLAARPALVAFNRWLDQVLQSYVVAVLLDVLDVALYVLGMYTNVIVVIHLVQAQYTGWAAWMIAFMCLHFLIMAVLVCAYLRRASAASFNVLGLSNADMRGSRWAWLAFIPLCIPAIVLLDLLLLVTSVAPVVLPRLTTNFSSFMSNYSFSRFFVQYVFEAVPQMILQTFIFFTLRSKGQTYFRAVKAIYASIAITAINVVKFSWKLWKASGDGGLTLLEYSKYLVLLKGNYDCSPGTMSNVIQHTCSVQAGTFFLNGFWLHRNKAQYGPAQQAYILLNAFDRFSARGVTRLVASGCPLASINRILEKGVKHFTSLESLELHECAVRGDTLTHLTRAIKKHKSLVKVKVIQTGILKKYYNRRKLTLLKLLKPSLQLTHVAFCLTFWNSRFMSEAAVLLHNHPTLQSFTIEMPQASSTSTSTSNPAPQDSLGSPSDGPSGGPSSSLAPAASTASAAAAASSSADYVYSLSSVLQHNSVLRSLSLHNHAFSEGGVVVLAKALDANTSLTALSLRGSCVGDGGASALARTLRHSSSLQSLCLSACSLHSEGVAALSASLVENRTLLSLDLGHNRVNSSGVRELGRALRLNTSLTSLRLEGWRDTFDDKAALATLAAALAGNYGLTALSLAGTQLPAAESWAQLGRALKENRCLRFLDLSRGTAHSNSTAATQGAGEQGGSRGEQGHGGGARTCDIAFLLQALGSAECAPLEELRLQGQALGHIGCLLPLSCLLASPSCRLRLLDLSHCQLGDAALAALSQGLLSACSSSAGAGGVAGAGAGAGAGQPAVPGVPLHTLLLRGLQGLGLRGMQALCAVLQHPACPLTSLDLSMCQVTGAGAGAEEEGLSSQVWGVLAGSLRSCRLHHLVLGSNQLRLPVLTALASALAGNSCLLSLDLTGCSEREVRLAFAALLLHRQAAASAAAGGKQGTGPGEDAPLLGEAALSSSSSAAGAGAEAVECVLDVEGFSSSALQSLKCSAELFEVVDLLPGAGAGG